MYASNSRASKYMKKYLTELQEETNKSATIVGDFNIPPSVINRTTQKYQWGHTRAKQHYQLPWPNEYFLSYTYSNLKTGQTQPVEYILPSNAYGTLTKSILCTGPWDKSQKKCKRIEIIQSTHSNCSEINNRKISGMLSSIWRLNNMYLREPNKTLEEKLENNLKWVTVLKARHEVWRERW